MPSNPTPITVAHGDGIGPEIMEAVLFLLEKAGAALEPDVIEIGEKKYREGYTSGIGAEAWESLRRTKVFLKAPITTPQGGGYKSLNVTIRKALGLYANVRPSRALHPYIRTHHKDMDLVIVRENEEDLYAGIEYRQTDQVAEALKLVTRPGCEKIIRHAFEYARQNNRTKVSCMIKDNIMKVTDGLFHRVFKEIAEEYPGIQSDSWIVDIGAARLADTPEMFDVIVTLNLYGDILSDIAVQLTGSVGLGGSSNVGDEVSMFEAIHGSAPPIAGKNIANPSGLLLGAVMMLVHIGQHEAASRLHNAWLRTIEEGVHTTDIFRAGVSKNEVGTREFARAVAERMGERPEVLRPVDYRPAERRQHAEIRHTARTTDRKDLVGMDVFLDWEGKPDRLGEALSSLSGEALKLVMISNRGVMVWPSGFPETFHTDHWRCRFLSKNEAEPVIGHAETLALLERLTAAGFHFVQTINLYNFEGKPGYSLGQGQ